MNNEAKIFVLWGGPSLPPHSTMQKLKVIPNPERAEENGG